MVLVVALLVLIPKLVIAALTYGTQDILTWTLFAKGVAERGPTGIYSINFAPIEHTIYNHPPLIGWYLQLTNLLSRAGIPLRFTIRAVSSAADMVSALLSFEILRRRTSLRRATSSGVLIGASPVLFLISGYHGNTDPLFVMFALLGAYLIVDRDQPLPGGAALALAISVKIVPVIVLPTLAVYLLRRRRDLLVRGFVGFAVVFLVIWTVPVITQWPGLQHNVLGYAGIPARQWGLVELNSQHPVAWLTAFLIGPGRTLIVLVAGGLPAVLVWRHPAYAIEGVCFSLVVFLALSPAFGVQYLAWTVAAAYILDFGLATVYNLLAGLFLFSVYYSWNGGLHWAGLARGRLFTPAEVTIGLIVWVVLIVIAVSQVRRYSRTFRRARPDEVG